MKPFFTGLLSRIFSRQAATAQRPKRFAKIVAHTFCSTASANTFQSVAFDILFGAAGFQIQIHKPYALTMLNLKGFCSLSNGHLKKARPGVRFSIIEKTAMHRFSRFPQPSCVKGAASGHKWHTCYAMVLWNCCACCHPVRASRGCGSKPNQSFWVWLQARNRMSFQPNKKHPMPLCLSAAPFPLCLRRSLRPAVQRGFPGWRTCCQARLNAFEAARSNSRGVFR